MVIAKWKYDGLFKANAQKVAEEIYSAGDAVTPQEILEKARDAETELHKCFEWDDSIAAEKWRVQTARDIVRSLIISKTPDKKEESPIRVFYKPENAEGYKPTEYIVRNKDAYASLLAQAKEELRIFKRKYHTLTELEAILELID